MAKQTRNICVLIISLLWITVNAWYWWDRSSGDDLSATYVGGQLVATGQYEHLYTYDSTAFHIQNDPVWADIAGSSHFEGFLHPYIQVPFWAAVWAPISNAISFPVFKDLFLVLILICLVLFTIISIKVWYSPALHPISFSLILAILSFSEPVRYTLFLVQTHPLIMFAVVLALYAYHSKKKILAGGLLAFATAVKITPGIILLYWLWKKDYKALASFLGAYGIFLLASILLTNVSTIQNYFARLSEINHTLLVAFNNQSLAATIGRWSLPWQESLNWHIFAMPQVSILLSAGLGFIGLLAIFYFSRNIRDRSLQFKVVAAFLLVLVTIVNGIAWSHYFFVLLPLLLCIYSIAKNKILSAIVILLVIGMQFYPLAINALQPYVQIQAYAFVSSHFYSALIGLVFLLYSVASMDRQMKH